MTPIFAASGNADGFRTCEVRHAVQHAHADGDLGCLRVGAACPQAVARDRLRTISHRHQVALWAASRQLPHQTKDSPLKFPG